MNQVILVVGQIEYGGSTVLGAFTGSTAVEEARKCFEAHSMMAPARQPIYSIVDGANKKVYRGKPACKVPANYYTLTIERWQGTEHMAIIEQLGPDEA